MGGICFRGARRQECDSLEAVFPVDEIGAGFRGKNSPHKLLFFAFKVVTIEFDLQQAGEWQQGMLRPKTGRFGACPARKQYSGPRKGWVNEAVVHRSEKTHQRA